MNDVASRNRFTDYEGTTHFILGSRGGIQGDPIEMTRFCLTVHPILGRVLGRHQAARDGIKATNGSIDAVIACAGLAVPTAKTVSVNYFGVTEFLFALQPTLALSKSPRVAVTSSMASLMPNSAELVEAMCADDEEEAVKIAQGLVNTGTGLEQLIYGSTKRAISRWIRRESIKPKWAGAGIALNAVGPGIVKLK